MGYQFTHNNWSFSGLNHPQWDSGVLLTHTNLLEESFGKTCHPLPLS